MGALNENARLSESSISPVSAPAGNLEVPNSQPEHSLMLHCTPLKEQPVNIPTSSMMLLSSTLNESSLSATVHGPMDVYWWSSVADVLQASLPSQKQQLSQAEASSISLTTVTPLLEARNCQTSNHGADPVPNDMGRTESASRKSSSGGGDLKRRGQAHSRRPLT